MSELRAFQRKFAAAISAPAAGRLRVYRNTVLHGAVEALRANYPVVTRLLGEEMFESLAVDFASAHPPSSPILALYGDTFAEWLENQSWILEFSYLPDVARVERMHIESLFAADAEPVHLGALAGADWDALKLDLHPAARFDWLLTPAVTLWLAHQHDDAAYEREFARTSEGVLITRPQLSVCPLELEPAQHLVLLAIANGASVGRAALAAAEAHPDADVGALFASLVNAGAFVAPSLERGKS